MVNQNIIKLLTLFIFLFVLVLIAFALTLTVDDRRNLLEDAGWFSVAFAFIIVILSIPDIQQDQMAIIMVIALLIMIITIISIGIIAKVEKSNTTLTFINNSDNYVAELSYYNTIHKILPNSKYQIVNDDEIINITYKINGISKKWDNFSNTHNHTIFAFDDNIIHK